MQNRFLNNFAALLLIVSAFSAGRHIRFSFAAPTTSAPGTYYLDCSASLSGNGTANSPWNSPLTVNAFNFRPGDHLMLKRDTVCKGPLAPQGSGAADLPIVVDASGSGARPVINGGTSEEAIRLFNQQYWEIQNLEIVGGDRYGVFVSGNIPNSTINHIYLRNLDVHGATFLSTKRADSGEIFVSPNGANQTLNDVLIDGVTAHDSHVSEGIFVSAGGAWIEKDGVSQPLGANVTVQNSVAHDIYGDGILIAEVNDGTLQRNVVYKSGLCPTCTGSTPVGLWEWYCHTCTIQYNESYANQSWGGDGGDFDIDYYDDNNVVQYNYGHDSAGYCVAFFAAGGRPSHNNIFRFNVCANNGRKSDLSKQGEVYVHTWEGGTLDGVQIYNNTFYWNPASNAAAFAADDAMYSGAGARFFKNNIIYATVPDLIRGTSAFILDNNIYWTTSSSPPRWQFDNGSYASFMTYQSASKQDIHSYYMDPKVSDVSYHGIGKPHQAFQLLPGSPAVGAGADICAGIRNCSMGSRDFWDRNVPLGRANNIGADQAP
jgi:hypothetical protein